ncbi:hypothetical protein, partial [Klebsiella pneumoniae]|uniref:hypothetical protein n=1 Tax=Klebsiella pneumoniae TaxID=573 RepID=UPI003CFEBD1B
TTLDILLQPDPSRTVIRPFDFGYPDAFAGDRPTRVQQVASRLMTLDEDMRTRMLGLLHEAMRKRHRNVDDAFLRRYAEMKDRL